jgi:integrase/recombinase XerD
MLVADIKPLAIEAWFESLTKPGGLKWPSVVKIKSIMNQVFGHAQRHELIPATIGQDGRPSNPVLFARTESETNYEAVAVSPEQMITILAELDFPETRLEWTLALLHAATALRPEEAFGLKWLDIDWKKNQINIRRGWSKGKETAGKNRISMTQVAMHPALAEALQQWRRETVYGNNSDWVFASRRARGKKPRSAGVAAQDYLRPAAVKAGVIDSDYRGRFGWHNLRHSLATFLANNDVSLSVIQQMLRHAKPATTAIYTHRTNAVQMAAQAKFLDAIKVTSATV